MYSIILSNETKNVRSIIKFTSEKERAVYVEAILEALHISNGTLNFETSLLHTDSYKIGEVSVICSE